MNEHVMRDVSRAVVLVLCAVVPVLGQQKVQPPPTRMALPSDSVQAPVGQPQPAAAETEKPELELPEVLIQGTDRIVRLKNEKESVVPDNPALVRPDTPPQIISSWFQLQAAKPQYQATGPEIRKSTWGHLQGGSYATFAGDLGHWQQFGALTLHGRGWLDRSAGQYQNSQHTRGGLELQSDYHLNSHLTTSVEGAYRLTQIGLQAAARPEQTRSGGTGTLGAGLQWDVAGNTTFQGRARFGSTRLTSDTTATELDRTQDRWSEASGEIVSQILGLQLGARGRYLQETLRQPNAAWQNTASFGEVGLESLFPITGALSAGIGMNYHAVMTDSLGTATRFSPFGRINFVPGNWLGISATVYSGYDYETYTQRWRENPYAAHALSLWPEETTLGWKISLDYQMTEALGIHAGVDYATMNTLYYWQRNPATGYFTDQNAGEVGISEIRGGASWQPGDWLELRGSLVTYSASYPTSSPLTGNAFIPYRPQVRLPLQAILSLPSAFQLTVDGEITGPRETGFNGTPKLSGYDLLNASISRTFGDKFTLLLSATNLLNEPYVAWEQYSEPGIRVFLGVKAKF